MVKGTLSRYLGNKNKTLLMHTFEECMNNANLEKDNSFKLGDIRYSSVALYKP